MRSPVRSTTTRNRTSNSPLSPEFELRPRPTLADIQIAPRRRLRDGSTSSRGKSRSSRGTSVTSSTTSSRASSLSRSARLNNHSGSGNSIDERRSTLNTMSGRRGTPRGRGRSSSRRESIASTSIFSESDGGSFIPSNSDSTSISRESSLSPPPISPRLTTTRNRLPSYEVPQQASRVNQRTNTRSIVDVMDEYDLSHHPSSLPQDTPNVESDSPTSPPPYPSDQSRNNGVSSGSNTSQSEEDIDNEIEQPNGRRYTAAEKGKGRAVISPIEIESTDSEEIETPNGEDVGDKSIQLLNFAQKRNADEMIDELERNSSDDILSGEEEIDEESTLAGGYTCPVCFCPPSQAVMTPCGHILCAQCLHSSLLAAIGRNPNPYPDRDRFGGVRLMDTSGRGRRGGAGGGGRPTRNSRNPYHTSPSDTIANHITRLRNIISMNGTGPKSWTKELLQEYYYFHLNSVCENQLKQNGVDVPEWEAIKELQLPQISDIKVEQKLKGLWRLEDAWVVEGECPVCRNALPGGYGPPGTGIGGIIPLQARLSDALTSSKRRK